MGRRDDRQARWRQLAWIQTLVVDRAGHERRPRGEHGLARPFVARLLDDDAIAGVEEDSRRQVERLL